MWYGFYQVFSNRYVFLYYIQYRGIQRVDHAFQNLGVKTLNGKGKKEEVGRLIGLSKWFHVRYQLISRKYYFDCKIVTLIWKVTLAFQNTLAS